MFWFFGHEVRGILAPQPGTKLTLLALEWEGLTTRPPGKPRPYAFLKESLDFPITEVERRWWKINFPDKKTW